MFGPYCRSPCWTRLFNFVFLTPKIKKKVSPKTLIYQVYWKWSHKFLIYGRRICVRVHTFRRYGLKQTDLRSFYVANNPQQNTCHCPLENRPGKNFWRVFTSHSQSINGLFLASSFVPTHTCMRSLILSSDSWWAIPQICEYQSKSIAVNKYPICPWSPSCLTFPYWIITCDYEVL